MDELVRSSAVLQVEAHESQSQEHEQQLSTAAAENQSLQSQLQAAGTHLHMTDTQLQASRLNMHYLKVRQQPSQNAPVLSYVQAYKVSCGSNGDADIDQGNIQEA